MIFFIFFSQFGNHRCSTSLNTGLSCLDIDSTSDAHVGLLLFVPSITRPNKSSFAFKKSKLRGVEWSFHIYGIVSKL